MSAAREELQEVLSCYITDTLQDINTVKEFCQKRSKWTLRRRTELNMMTDIKDRAANSSRAELEKELEDVLKDALSGLEKLHCFLDAVENLAVTSLLVFTVENRMLKLPEGISHEDVQLVITDAQTICPLLLEFKRDASVFFRPKLQIVEVLSYQLNRYIQTTQKVCDKLNCDFGNFSLELNDETLVDLDMDLSEDDIQRMLCDINELNDIRMNQSSRTVFLFEEELGSGFTTQFSERRSRMLQSLEELEEAAVKLDRMCKGAKISSVAGSSVGAAGGVLSIIGLALMPVTAGASLVLTATGLGMGITSGANTAVTLATELGVNNYHQKKASEALQSLHKDMESLQVCLEEASNRETSPMEVVLGVGKVLCKAAPIASASKVAIQQGSALRNIPRVAAEVPEVGQAAAKAVALSKSARAGFIGLNVLFIGMDIFFICKDSISLANGSETEFSQFLRARAALWSSELDSWQKIYDFLNEGLPTSKKNKAALERPFLPEREGKETEEEGTQEVTDVEPTVDEVEEKQNGWCAIQ